MSYGMSKLASRMPHLAQCGPGVEGDPLWRDGFLLETLIYYLKSLAAIVPGFLQLLLRRV